MKIALDEIIMSTFKMNGKLKFNGHEYLIDFSLSGDMVWLHIERGLLGPLSNFPCYCCEIERSDLSKNNSETCKSLMRTLAKSEICIKKKKLRIKKATCILQFIFLLILIKFILIHYMNTYAYQTICSK